MAKKKTGGGKNKAEKELTKAQRIEAKKAKQAAKGAKKDRKGVDEEDIELILQEILKKDAQRKEVIVEATTQPSPRANFSMTMLPTGDMMMFGGEYFDGDTNVCYNELYRWNVDGGPTDWKMISSPNTPPPRCSHQAAVFRDHLYIFGGEFATADQFHHYRDFWRLDLKTNSWEALEDKGGPSPRSGHRMVVWRNYLVVFGGFYEAARETKWYNDLFLFSFAEMKWHKVTYPPLKAVPGARSGFQLAVHPSKDQIFLYGGYAKVKNVGEKSEGKVFSDLWALNMAPVLKRQEPTWEKLSRKGQAPSPRGGTSVTVHKQRFILFGGVYDDEQRGHAMKSTFYNDLFVYDMDRRRWFEFKLRGKKQADGKRRRKKKDRGEQNGEADNDNDDASDGSDEEDEDDFERMLENQFGYIDQDGNFVYIKDDEEEEKNDEAGGEEEETKEEEEDDSSLLATQRAVLNDEEEEKKEEEEDDSALLPPPAPVAAEPVAPSPCPRINPALIIRGSTLYVYGGMVEDGDREITLDDCWALDLKRLEEWKELLPGTMSEQVWKGEVSETEESSEGDDDDDEDDDDEDYEDEEAAVVVQRAVKMLKENDSDEEESGKKEKKKKSKSKKTNDRRAIRAEIEKLQEQLGLDDINRTPQMGENLRDFFARTQEYWATVIGQRPDTIERQLNIKEIKREGFVMAEERYNELLPILERLNVLEAEQKEMEEQYLLKKKGGKEKARRG
ncbi:hypothetical protein Poli38472_011446 [Pythium oligandrum]|uniref:DUF4110 domain-containing protein n=1 Tax=Pythium oligandrum TaxID=41045 RepID=A0A8K1CJ50_PYTOL|nr:hypothetical protein Poli38472_011446 [Pythium oligandrum]|eukprot:TMW64566.1 hypothetical protein Poli38472_011446 [Pythium oligandrum]